MKEQKTQIKIAKVVNNATKQLEDTAANTNLPLDVLGQQIVESQDLRHRVRDRYNQRQKEKGT